MGITHTLEHDHRLIEQCLRALEGICARLEHGERVPAEALTEIYNFIDIYAEGYHRGKEEKHLIPALMREGTLVGDGTIETTLGEHAAELQVLRALEQAIQVYSNGQVNAAAQVALRSREYVAILTGHFEQEESILFQVVDEVLPDDVRDSLAFAFQRAEEELGSGGRGKYEDMARNLETNWAI